MTDHNKILNSPFDIKIHKENFINYLEVCILEDGTIQYAVPSHQEKLISICMKKYMITRDELYRRCPPEYYLDFINWLCTISNTIAVWNDHYEGQSNQKQINSLKILKMNGLYRGSLINKKI